MREMTVKDFSKGERVVFVPHHISIMDILRFTGAPLRNKKKWKLEEGVVSSTNDTWVFVKFDNLDMKMVTGDEPYTAQACDPRQLVTVADLSSLP